MFDPDFFNIPQAEAIKIDPQHRLLLECSWEALERAGYTPGTKKLTPSLASSTGVFVGVWSNDYRDLQLAEGKPTDRFFSSGGSKAMAAGRVAFHFGFGGPTLSVDTACSSSLVAIHLACSSLRDGECNLAIAGGVNLILAPYITEGFLAAKMLSPTDTCAAFDNTANGYARGEGCGVIALKRLQDALLDGDDIMGVISGSATNNNGKTSSIITPSALQQEQAIRKALRFAKIQPHEVTYIEAHGTGTQLGDVIEMEALHAIFSKVTVGSVKANIGHLESAAGIAGLMKVLAMLKYKAIPPHPTFKSLNKQIPEGKTSINTSLVAWDAKKLVAGVSSFGFSGTNAHVVVSEPEKKAERPTPAPSVDTVIIGISAKTERSLREICKKLAVTAGRTNLQDFAFTINSRSQFQYNLAVVASSAQELARELLVFGDGGLGTRSEYGISNSTNKSEEPRPIFLFPGQGVRYLEFTREVYSQWSTFRSLLDKCDRILQPLLRPSISSVLANAATPDEAMSETWSQTVLFAVEWSLAHTFLTWGIKPSCFLGHSLGELVSACVAGEFSVEEGLTLAFERSKLLSTTSEGSMLATQATTEQISQLDAVKKNNVCIAAINTPKNHTLAGSSEGIQSARSELSNLGVKTIFLQTQRAFHSQLVDPILPQFEEKARVVTFHPPSLPIGSAVLGEIWSESRGIRGADYWRRQVRAIVNFGECLRSAAASGYSNCFLEVGPASLLPIVSETIPYKPIYLLPTMRKSEKSALASSLAKLYTLGARINWSRVNPAGRFLLDLPTYEFDRRRCWLDSRQPDPPLPLLQSGGSGKIRHVVRDLVGRIYGRAVADTENLLSLGMDSLMATELRFAISSVLPGVEQSLPSSFFVTYPTIDHIVRYVKQASPRKLATSSMPSALPINVNLWQPSTVTPDVQTLPLSGIQRAYWLGKQSLGGSGGHLYREYEVSSLFDTENLTRAINDMIQRHQILRAVVTEDGQLNILSQVSHWNIQVLSASDAQAIDSARTSLQNGPDIHRWPLFDVVVIEGKSSAIILAAISLFLLDGFSEKLIADELFSYFMGRPVPAPTKLSYMDCLNGLNALRHSSAHEKAREYWRAKITTFPSRPEIPLNVCPSHSHLNFEHHERRLPRDTWETIKSICMEQGTTPNTLLLALYIQVLGRWSQNKSFALTVMMTRRTSRVHTELDRVMGNLSSTLLIAAKCTNVEVSLAHFVHDVANDVSSALDNSAMDGLEVVQEINRHLKRPFDAYAPFAFSSVVGVRPEYLEYPRNPVRRTYSCATLPHTWMDLQTSEESGSLLYSFDILSGVFSEIVVGQLVASYEHLLTSIATRDSWKVPFSSLFKTPRVAEPVSPDRPVPPVLLYQPFLEKAKENPEKIAIIDSNLRLTYGELDKYSFSVAASLPRSSGVEVVAVLLSKGWRQVVATLGILRGHMTYMPLDPKLPEQRIQHLLNASGAVAIVSDSATWESCSVGGLPIAFIDVDKVMKAASWDFVLDIPDIPATTTAYLLYTSGSTGIPKGVCCHHLGAYNTNTDLVERFEITSQDSVLSLSSLSFDLSVFDIFGMLEAGGTIVMPPAAGTLDPELWLEAVQEHSVSVWNTVPAFMDLLLSAAESSSTMLPSSLRLVMMSGDLVPPTLPQRIRDLSPNKAIRVVCLGGATEAAIWSNIFDTSEKVDWPSIPYGRPLRNQSMIILDPHMQLCEEWVIGVIHIGGVGVANGYLNDDKQTAKQFLDTEKYGRLFRTGDLGRLRGGLIEILGREDSQVKINGFRIELGEIERTAGRFASIDDCCVVVTSTSLLVAFVVPAEGHTVDFASVREYLSLHLPHYMIPHLFQSMNSLPLTSNGKVDRKTLTALANEQQLTRVHAQTPKLPESEKETQLHSAIGKVLGFFDFGVDQDLFELGCDSVTLLNIVGELRKDGIRLKIADIFQHPTISKLVEVVQALEEDSRCLFQVVPQPEDQYLPFQMIGIQRGYWLGMYVSDAYGGINNHFFREYEVQGDFSPERMENAINKLISRHPMLKAIVTDSGEVLQLREVPHWKLPLHKVGQGEPFDPAEIRCRLLAGPDPHKWPLWQLSVYQLAPYRWHIFLDTSIMMLDGVAGGILVSEFLQFYNHPELDMEPLTLTFRDYALAYQNLAKTPAYEDARKYWLARVNSLPLPPTLPILLDRKPQVVEGRHFRHYGGRVNSQIWSTIQQVCSTLQITPTIMFCTLYSEILSHWSRNHHFLITVMHTKRWPVHPQANLVVGNFSQTVLLEIDLTDSSVASFESHCKRVTRQLTQDLDHAEFTGTDVAQEINRKRGSQFQAVAPYAFTSTLSFDGLSTTPEVKERTPFTGRRTYSLVTVPHTWLDHQVAEDCGELLYNFDVLDDTFDPELIKQMVSVYEMLLHSLCDPLSWKKPVGSLFEGPEPAHATISHDVTPVLPTHHSFARGRAVLPKDLKPSTQLEKAVALDVSTILKIPVESITLTSNFFDMGGNSLTALQLIMQLKSRFHISTNAARFFSNPTVAALCSDSEGTDAKAVNALSSGERFDPTIISLRQPSHSEPSFYGDSPFSAPLFLIHAAGASVLSYRALVNNFAKFSFVLGVDDGAMLDDSIPFVYRSIEEVSDAYFRTIFTHLNNKNIQKCFIGGWSFGGVVSLEVTRKLEKAGIHVLTCFMLDSPLVRSDSRDLHEKERERLEEILGRSGDGATRAKNHFLHCTDLLRQHKTLSDPRIEAPILHFIASTTLLPVSEVTSFAAATTKQSAKSIVTRGDHFTILSDINAPNLAQLFESEIENLLDD